MQIYNVEKQTLTGDGFNPLTIKQREMNKLTGITSRVAICLDCEERWEGDDARKKGYNHAKDMGHRVNVEQVHSTIFTPQKGYFKPKNY